MTLDGHWWSYFARLNGERIPCPIQHPKAQMTCCVASGPRGLLLIPQWAVMKSKNGIVINLYAAGTAVVKLDDGVEVAVLQQTSYPETGVVSIRINPKKDLKFPVSLRIPSWSKVTKLSVNGQTMACEPGHYANVDRVWSSGDRVELVLDMRDGRSKLQAERPRLPWRAARFCWRLIVDRQELAIRRFTLMSMRMDMCPSIPQPPPRLRFGWRLRFRFTGAEARPIRSTDQPRYSATMPRQATCLWQAIRFEPACRNRCISSPRMRRKSGSSRTGTYAHPCHLSSKWARKCDPNALGQQDPPQLAFWIVYHATVIIEHHRLAANRITRRPS